MGFSFRLILWETRPRTDLFLLSLIEVEFAPHSSSSANSHRLRMVLYSNNGLQMCVLLACFVKEDNLLIYGNGQSALHLISPPSCFRSAPPSQVTTPIITHQIQTEMLSLKISQCLQSVGHQRRNQKSSNFPFTNLNLLMGKTLK